MTDSTDELMKSYEVIRSVVARHSQYDAARILTLNLATCITAGSRQDETAGLARLAHSICTLCDAARDMLKDDTQAVAELLRKRREKLNYAARSKRRDTLPSHGDCDIARMHEARSRAAGLTNYRQGPCMATQIARLRRPPHAFRGRMGCRTSLAYGGPSEMVDSTNCSLRVRCPALNGEDPEWTKSRIFADFCAPNRPIKCSPFSVTRFARLSIRAFVHQADP
jgi:hypothetical protein